MEPIAIAVFDIDGVIRDVGGSYRRAIADTVEHFTHSRYRPTLEDIDQLKSEGIWNNDWKASEAMIHRYYDAQENDAQENDAQNQPKPQANYEEIVDYFQKQYRGPDTEDPNQWTGYIANEPLLVDKNYLQSLATTGIPYAFFSGATRGSANFVLQRRIGLASPILIAMEDAPGKPDPTGLMQAVEQVETQQTQSAPLPVIYAGDTAADMKTIVAAREKFPRRQWLAIGILPPHALKNDSYAAEYADQLRDAGAQIVLDSAQKINAELVSKILQSSAL